jgi:glycosyltransferase involved in cell wall biosynthesis
MRIGIDARMLAHSGIGTYTRHILAGLAAEPGGHRYVVFTAPELVSQVPVAPHFETCATRVPVYALAEHGRWRRELESARCDLYHIPHYNVPFGFTPPFVVTVHDLIHWLFPHFLRSPMHAAMARALLRHAVQGATRVIADSACTRDDLQRLLALPAGRTAVIPLGVDARFQPLARAAVEDFRRRNGLPPRFVLYVGLRRPHKNLPRLVRAFAALQRRRPSDVALVLWGRPDERDRATEHAIATTGSEAHVLRTHAALADEEMPLLYNAAWGVVLPSLYEGFGLPAVEAMACGVPVLASRGGALPEVVGSAALLADPYDELALSAGLERLVHDESRRTELTARGVQRARAFDWQYTARRVREVYEAAGGAGGSLQSSPG